MKIFNKVTGNKGEDLAEEFLKTDGYQIRERNYHTKFGEIDIICQKEHTIIFVEVKTKTGLAYGSPEEMINQHKLEQVRKTAEVYLTKNNLNNYLCRIDMIAIIITDNLSKPELTHYQNLY